MKIWDVLVWRKNRTIDWKKVSDKIALWYATNNPSGRSSELAMSSAQALRRAKNIAKAYGSKALYDQWKIKTQGKEE